MWNIALLNGSRDVAKTKLAGTKDVPTETLKFIAGEIDSLPAAIQSVTVNAVGADITNPNNLTVTRIIQITIRGQQG